jgi:hypothetical protein
LSYKYLMILFGFLDILIQVLLDNWMFE